MAHVLSRAVLEDETEQELYLNHRNSEGRVPENQENWNIVTQILAPAVENSNVKLVAALTRRGDAMAKMIVIYIRKTMISVTKIFVNFPLLEEDLAYFHSHIMGKLTHDVLRMGVTSPGVDIVLTIKEKCIRGIGTIANMTETLNKMAPNLKVTKFC